MNFKKLSITVATILFLNIFFSNSAFCAPTYIHVSDMSLVQYQLTADGNVYFRNLNAFNSTVTGCCYAFVLDTTTPYGKSAWSIILMKMASKQDLYLFVSDSNPPTSGAPARIDQVGNW